MAVVLIEVSSFLAVTYLLGQWAVLDRTTFRSVHTFFLSFSFIGKRLHYLVDFFHRKMFSIFSWRTFGESGVVFLPKWDHAECFIVCFLLIFFQFSRILVINQQKTDLKMKFKLLPPLLPPPPPLTQDPDPHHYHHYLHQRYTATTASTTNATSTTSTIIIMWGLSHS